MNSEPMYYVDYIFEEKDVNANAIIEIAEMGDIWSSSVDEPYIAVKNLKITKGMLSFFKETTIKIALNNKYYYGQIVRDTKGSVTFAPFAVTSTDDL